MAESQACFRIVWDDERSGVVAQQIRTSGVRRAQPESSWYPTLGKTDFQGIMRSTTPGSIVSFLSGAPQFAERNAVKDEMAANWEAAPNSHTASCTPHPPLSRGGGVAPCNPRKNPDISALLLANQHRPGQKKGIRHSCCGYFTRSSPLATGLSIWPD